MVLEDRPVRKGRPPRPRNFRGEIGRATEAARPYRGVCAVFDRTRFEDQGVSRGAAANRGDHSPSPVRASTASNSLRVVHIGCREMRSSRRMPTVYRWQLCGRASVGTLGRPFFFRASNGVGSPGCSRSSGIRHSARCGSRTSPQPVTMGFAGT